MILGIETSCDETGVAVYDLKQQRILSNVVFSQIKEHEKYGGVVPEIASRSHIEKIGFVIKAALKKAHVLVSDVDVIAVVRGPGLVGSIFIGLCFAKGLTWARKKRFVGVDHLEAHIFSAFLKDDYTVEDKIEFPHLCFSVSGGHTTLYLVKDFGLYEKIGYTRDDAAGEAFDKVAKILGMDYPGGPIIEKLAGEVNFKDFFHYPRTKSFREEIVFSFSGLKTAVLYDLVKKDAYDLRLGTIMQHVTQELKQQAASSFLVCVGDIFVNNIKLAFEKYPDVKSFTFVGGVACNNYLRERLKSLCESYNKSFFVASPQFCTDNAAMVAFVGGYKALQGEFSNFNLDIIN